MRIVLQRVSAAAVWIDGRAAGAVGCGFCVLLAVSPTDTDAEADWLADKVVGLRLFPDAEGRMNRALGDVAGGVLVVSQFTLYGDVSRGRRPSFVGAARPEHAIPRYERFIAALRTLGIPVATGEFGADMQLEIHNDGPVTLILDREAQ